MRTINGVTNPCIALDWTSAERTIKVQIFTDNNTGAPWSKPDGQPYINSGVDANTLADKIVDDLSRTYTLPNGFDNYSVGNLIPTNESDISVITSQMIL